MITKKVEFSWKNSKKIWEVSGKNIDDITMKCEGMCVKYHAMYYRFQDDDLKTEPKTILKKNVWIEITQCEFDPQTWERIPNKDKVISKGWTTENWYTVYREYARMSLGHIVDQGANWYSLMMKGKIYKLVKMPE